MSRRKGPTAHLWLDDGGMVTGCDDPAIARPLLLAELADSYGYAADDPEFVLDHGDAFPVDAAKVQRGRVVPVAPDSWQRDEGFAWLWLPLPADRAGRGVTTAVVWQVTR